MCHHKSENTDLMPMLLASHVKNALSSEDGARSVKRRKPAKKKRCEEESATDSSSAFLPLNTGASTSAAARDQVGQLRPTTYGKEN